MITHKTPLIEIRRPEFADDIRRAMVANALWCVGLEAGNPETRPLFEELLGPVPGGGKWDLSRPFRMWQKNGKWYSEGVSTCAMVALRILSRLWPAAPDIMDGYDIGTGLDVGSAFARKCGAWQKPVAHSGLLPNRGAIVQVNGPMHVLVVTALNDTTIESVDGGQVGAKGLQAVTKRTRDVTWKNGLPFIGGREVLGWIEVDLLQYEPGQKILVPRGWEMVEV